MPPEADNESLYDPDLDWQAIAIRLMDCHAATIEDPDFMKRLPKYERDRMLSIGKECVGLLNGVIPPPYKDITGQETDVRKRLEDALCEKS